MKKIEKKGFTLVEMLIAVSLFIVVVTISIGAILTIFDANRKARSSKTVMDNLNYAVESMTRTIRFGNTYHCGNTGSLSNPNDCSGGESSIAVNFEGSTVIYRLNGTALERSDNGGSDYLAITSPETVIQHLKFYVFGSDSSDEKQPYVVAVIKGYSGERPTSKTTFSIETFMSQRTLDL